MPNGRPMLFYFLGYYSLLHQDASGSARFFRLAAQRNPDRCFPNRLDSILALQAALEHNPADARAAFYLGNLWYDKGQVADATACWESARRHEPSLPTVHRNLALVYFNKQRNPAKALASLERAFRLDSSDARLLFELDLLKRRNGVSPKERLAFLQTHRGIVEQREDLLLEWITLLNLLGRHQEALDLLLARQFHPWEGGEGKVTGQYVLSLLELAKQKLTGVSLHGKERSGDGAFRDGEGQREAARQAAADAAQLLKRARAYPPNLGEGKLHGAQENQVLYWLGMAREQLGKADAAREAWRQAATGMSVPTPAIYYNDQNPETIYYQGLALQKLGRPAAARARFQTLVNFGKAHLRDHVVLDYFAVSLPEFLVFDDDLDLRNQVNCRFLMALGQIGLGRTVEGRKQLERVLKLDPNHLGALLQQRALRGAGTLICSNGQSLSTPANRRNSAAPKSLRNNVRAAVNLPSVSP